MFKALRPIPKRRYINYKRPFPLFLFFCNHLKLTIYETSLNINYLKIVCYGMVCSCCKVLSFLSRSLNNIQLLKCFVNLQTFLEEPFFMFLLFIQKSNCEKVEKSSFYHLLLQKVIYS